MREPWCTECSRAFRERVRSYLVFRFLDNTFAFSGVEGSGDYREHAKMVGADTVLSFGGDSVTLVGVGLGSLSGEGIVIG
jgi:hypothetical protein